MIAKINSSKIINTATWMSANEVRNIESNTIRSSFATTSNRTGLKIRGKRRIVSCEISVFPAIATADATNPRI